MTCDNCARLAELQEEVTELRLQLSYEVDRRKADRFRKGLQLSPQQGDIVAMLFNANGRAVSRGQLFDTIAAHGNGSQDIDPKIVDVQVHRIRRAAGFGFIETIWGRGYQLSDLARERCEAILAAGRAA